MEDAGLQLHKPRHSKSAAGTPPQMPSAPRHNPGRFFENSIASLQNVWASLTPRGKVRSTDDTVLVPKGTTTNSITSQKSPHWRSRSGPTSSGHVGPGPIRTTVDSIAPSQVRNNDSTSPPNTIADNISPLMPNPVPNTASESANSNNDEQANSLHCKTVASDCIVDFALSLPTKLEYEWDTKVCGPLIDSISRSLPDTDFTVELVMTRSSENGKAEPTVLSMCSLPEHQRHIQRQIQRILRHWNYVHNHTRLKVIVLDIERCTTGSLSTGLDPVPRDEKFIVDIAISKAGEHSVLFGKLAKLYREKDVDSAVFSTIGGVVSVGGTLYGLTTAHGIQSIDSRRQKGPRASAFTSIGHIECSDWASGNQNENAKSGPNIQTGSDWALVKLQIKDLAYNEYHLPGVSSSKKVTGYLRNQDIGAGQVTVHAGVSGTQKAFLSGKISHVVMAGSVFQARSVSLEVPLVDGDSGSWVVRDDKLCGYVFARVGRGMTWGYMVPIEHVFDAIAKYWHYHYQQEGFPEIAEASGVSEPDPGLGPVQNRLGSSTLSEVDTLERSAESNGEHISPSVIQSSVSLPFPSKSPLPEKSPRTSWSPPSPRSPLPLESPLPPNHPSYGSSVEISNPEAINNPTNQIAQEPFATPSSGQSSLQPEVSGLPLLAQSFLPPTPRPRSNPQHASPPPLSSSTRITSFTQIERTTTAVSTSSSSSTSTASHQSVQLSTFAGSHHPQSIAIPRDRRRRSFVRWVRRRFRRQLPWLEGWMYGRRLGLDRREARRAIRAAEEAGFR